MEHLWRSRPPPQPLDLDALLAPAGATDGAIAATTDGAAAGGKGDSAVGADAAGGGSVAKGLGLADAHAVWGLPQQAQLFLAATQAFLDGRADEVGSAQVRGVGWEGWEGWEVLRSVRLLAATQAFWDGRADEVGSGVGCGGGDGPRVVVGKRSGSPAIHSLSHPRPAFPCVSFTATMVAVEIVASASETLRIC